MLQAIAVGVIDNLLEMMPVEVLKQFGIQKVICTGNSRSEPYFSTVVRRFADSFEVERATLAEASAAFGAAVFTAQRLSV